jgi:subtilase family serine protease
MRPCLPLDLTKGIVLKKYLPITCVIIVLTSLLIGGLSASNAFKAHAANPNITPAITPTTTTGSATAPSTMTFVPACSQVASGFARCMAMVSTTNVEAPVATTSATSTGIVPAAQAPGTAAPYGPAALHNAYTLPTMAPTNQTIAIVDAFDDPNAETDLATYRSMFGIPACTTANGCFRKVNQTGGTTPPTANTSWGTEISLDLDMVSAICYNCNILLVEANAASTADLGAAVNEAVALGANEVSNSYGGMEFNGESTVCNSFYDHPGVAVTASSGDFGLGVEVPSTCPNVTSIGGTTLSANGSETAWNTSATSGAGGGCSAQIPIPTNEVQTVTNCATRATSDVSAVADPKTGVYVFDTFGQGGGLQVGGTSASAPIIAATFALAGGTTNVANSASVPWTNRANNCLNTVGGVTYAFQSGLGSPKGTTCF